MRRFLLTALIVAGACNVWAQKQKSDKISLIDSPINIASQEIRKSFTPPADMNLKSGVVLKSDFQVEFVNFPENAKSAVLYAISIYENLISSTVPIKVQVKWKSMGTNVLSTCAPTAMHKNFHGARLSDVYYPIALAEKLNGNNMNGSEPDMVCTFNSGTNWYLGTNGDGPSSQYDMVTVALHEIIHGLGFVGFFDVSNGLGTLEKSNGCPSIYDYFIFNMNNQQLASSENFAIPSAALKDQLQSNNIVAKGNDGKNIIDLYAPATWNDGSSIYHYPESGFEKGDANALMSPYLFKGEAIHHPGDLTLELLANFGWKSLSFEGTEIKDFEQAIATLPVFVEVGGELNVDQNSVKISFSNDNFTTTNTVNLNYNSDTHRFEGELPLNNARGKISYYYSAKTTDNAAYTYPERAPDRKLSFTIGADYYPPVIKHNPEKLIASTHPVLDLDAVAIDNIGIKTVEVNYKINGVAQEAFVLNKEAADNYGGQIQFPVTISENDVVEYRLKATDNSARGNKRFLPTSGYYSVEVFEPEKPLAGYYTDFDDNNNDFEISDFEVNRPYGFSSGNLHTVSPYPQSNLDNGRYNLVAQLKHPIIIEENGLMTFDEVVLVEPGEEGAIYTEEIFWDFVIVEGSKNNGKSWLPVTDGYDSGVDELWSSHFNGSLKSAVSQASGHENMFLPQSINLTENTQFEAGDTVIFRFRLASDKAVTGWGWAIDNLAIQEVTTSADEILAKEDVSIYPNPFKQSIFVEGFKPTEFSDVEIIVTDLYGKTVFRETRYDADYNRKLKIDMPDVAPGVYMACITDNQSNTITQKIIKN